MTAYPLLFLAGVSAVEAWTGVTAPVASLGLRASRSSCGLHAATMAVDHSSDGKRLGRRAMIEFASKVTVAPLILGAANPRVAAAESLGKDTADALGAIPLGVVKVCDAYLLFSELLPRALSYEPLTVFIAGNRWRK
jgi:hypothetical protein